MALQEQLKKILEVAEFESTDNLKKNCTAYAGYEDKVHFEVEKIGELIFSILLTLFNKCQIVFQKHFKHFPDLVMEWPTKLE